jgi:hypothetical protein
MQRYSYPETLYRAPKIPGYSSFAEQKRLSGPSLRMFFKIMQKWEVDPKDTRLLLDEIASRRFNQLSVRPDGRILKQDQLLRVTSIIAMDDSLHTHLPRKQAEDWAQALGRRCVFYGRKPLSDIVEGGHLLLWELRCRLEAVASESNGTES